MVMYHGTPNGTYTVFRSGSYFTKDSAYADKYQNPGASSLSVKRTADAPKTYKVYLNITKPFDTRNATERRIFQEEFFRKYGTGTPLAESGLPDWVDGMDLQEFIEEMDYDYDGLILDEGGTGGYGEDVISRGLSYVTFSPDQVKNVDNKTPTNDPDVRFSRELDMKSDDYRNFGWVRDNNVISAGYWKTFTTNFADAVKRNYYFNKTPNGEFMIEAYNYYDPLSAADVVVFAKGTIESPIVTKIVKIDEQNETKLSEIRRDLYETARRGIQPKAGGIFRLYNQTNLGGNDVATGIISKMQRYNNRLDAKRSRSEIAANPITQFHVDEDKGTISITYANGETVTESLEEKPHYSRELDAIDYIDEQAERAGRLKTAFPKFLCFIGRSALFYCSRHSKPRR